MKIYIPYTGVYEHKSNAKQFTRKHTLYKDYKAFVETAMLLLKFY
jgi:hypothetical protein